MIDVFLTAFIASALVLITVFKAKYCPKGNDTFFDASNTKAMRGFWSIIVILVHTPTPYQNTLQDMIGSFAYIGVTFFFLTSAYGLTVSRKGLEGFWKYRLRKLLLPQIFVNIVFLIIFLIMGNKSISAWTIFKIDKWVCWLMACMFVWWLFNQRFLPIKRIKYPIIVFVIIIGSLSSYLLEKNDIVSNPIWPTEVIGFVWGIVLAILFEKLYLNFNMKWNIILCFSCLTSGILGVLYLNTKTILFLGDYLLKIVLGLCITIFILTLKVRFKIGNKIIGFLGMISYEVYLVHFQVFAMIRQVWPNLRSGVFIVVSVGLSISIATLVHMTVGVIEKTLVERKNVKSVKFN